MIIFIYIRNFAASFSSHCGDKNDGKAIFIYLTWLKSMKYYACLVGCCVDGYEVYKKKNVLY